jgi:hypothetical protein
VLVLIAAGVHLWTLASTTAMFIYAVMLDSLQYISDISSVLGMRQMVFEAGQLSFLVPRRLRLVKI